MSEQRPAPSAWRLFAIWASIGLQSFGGGASTTFLIQRAFIEQYGWVSDAEFLRLWNLCLLTPGINLVALTILLGKKLGGTRGILVSLLGMLAPSGAITCALAALFVQVERSNTTQAALRGLIPATGGIMLLVLYTFVKPLVQSGRRAGWTQALLSLGLTVVSAVAVIAFNVSAIVIIVVLAALGAFLFAPRGQAPATAEPVEEATR